MGALLAVSVLAQDEAANEANRIQEQVMMIGKRVVGFMTRKGVRSQERLEEECYFVFGRRRQGIQQPI